MMIEYIVLVAALIIILQLSSIIYLINTRTSNIKNFSDYVMLISLIIDSMYKSFKAQKLSNNEIAQKLYTEIMKSIDSDKIKSDLGLNDTGLEYFISSVILQYLDNKKVQF